MSAITSPTEGDAVGQSPMETQVSQPPLHKAAMDDSPEQFLFLLQDDTSRCISDWMRDENEDGYSVLQAACKVGSLQVVKLLVRGAETSVPQWLLIELIGEKSAIGDTALHIAAKSEYPLILHELLKATDKSSLPDLLEFRDAEDKTLEDIAKCEVAAGPKDGGYTSKCITSTIIESHKKIVYGEWAKFFEEHPYSLYNIDVNEKMLREMYQKTSTHNPEELGAVRFKNFDTMICLEFYRELPYAKENDNALRKARLLIDEVTQIEQGQNGIHALSNKAVYILRQDTPELDQTQLQDIAYRILDLLIAKEDPYYLSMVDFANGLADTDLSDDNRKEVSRSLREVMSIQYVRNSNYLSAYCAYFLAKTLIRRAQDRRNGSMSGEDLCGIIEEAVECQILVAKDNESREFIGDRWIWLAELQSPSIKGKIKDEVSEQRWRASLTKYQREVGLDRDVSTDIESCIEHAEKEATELKREPKYMARIGKLYRQTAIETNCKDSKLRLFSKARDISAEFIVYDDLQPPLFMAVDNYTTACLGIWGIRYMTDQEQKDKVEWEYKNLKHPNGFIGEAGGWRFASTEYFGPASDVEGLLEQTVKPLSNIVFKQNGANTSGIKLARVKALLGKPVNDVEEVFQYTLDECEKENRTKNYEMWGMYYESIRDTEKAIEQYEHAIGYHQSRGTGGGWEPRFAKRRVGILQKQ